MAPPAPPVEVCLRAAWLWATGNSYPEVAEILRGEGYDGQHPPKPRCGSQQTALNWAARGRRYAEDGENYAAGLDREDGRLVLAEALLKDMATVSRAVERDQLSMKEALDAKRWIYREFSRLIGGDAPTQIAVTTRRADPGADPSVQRDIEATLAQDERDAQLAREDAARREMAEERRSRRRAAEGESA